MAATTCTNGECVSLQSTYPGVPEEGNIHITGVVGASQVLVNSLTTPDSTAQLAVSTGAAGNKGLVIQGVASQTADLLQVQDSAGNVQLRVDPAGLVALGADTTIDIVRSALTIKIPGGDDLLNGITIKAPSSTWGPTEGMLNNTYGRGQFLEFLKESGSPSNPTEVALFRVDSTGGLGVAGGVHVATGLRQDAGYKASQAVWINPSIDTAGIVLTGVSTQTQDLIQFQKAGGGVLSRVTAKGEFQVPKGNAAVPGLQFLGDTNTGIFSSAADVINFATGGGNRLRVYSNNNNYLSFQEGKIGYLTVDARSTNAAGSAVVVVAGNAGAGPTGKGGGNAILAGGNAAGSAGAANGGVVAVYGGQGINGGNTGNVLLAHNGTNPVGMVAIGSAAPSAELHVSSAVSGQALLKVTDASSGAVDVLAIADEGATTFRNRTNSANAFQIQDAAGSSLFTIDTANARITLKDTTINGTLTVNGHVITGNSNGGTTVATSLDLGLDGTATLSPGSNDSSGQIIITSGLLPSAGQMATITFANPYGSLPKVLLTPGDINASTVQYYVTTTNTTAVIFLNNPTSGTEYSFYYWVTQ